MDWTDDIDHVLNAIRMNCVLLNKAHKKRYFELKNSLKYYRLPVIVLNGCNSIISVGLQPYANQGAISLTTSLIALTILYPLLLISATISGLAVSLMITRVLSTSNRFILSMISVEVK